jgi:hypothetical protein
MWHALIANLQPRDCSRGRAARGAEIVGAVRNLNRRLEGINLPGRTGFSLSGLASGKENQKPTG